MSIIKIKEQNSIHPVLFLLENGPFTNDVNSRGHPLLEVCRAPEISTDRQRDVYKNIAKLICHYNSLLLRLYSVSSIV